MLFSCNEQPKRVSASINSYCAICRHNDEANKWIRRQCKLGLIKIKDGGSFVRPELWYQMDFEAKEGLCKMLFCQYLTDHADADAYFINDMMSKKDLAVVYIDGTVKLK